MGGKLDQVKGRIKEAAGVLTDDDRLKREGKLDQVVGKVKETAEQGGGYSQGRSDRQQTPPPGQVMRMDRQIAGERQNPTSPGCRLD